jgi:hypothetical protein
MSVFILYGWTHVFRKGKQFLFHQWHSSNYSSYKTGDMSWISKEPDCDYNKHSMDECFYFVAVNYIIDECCLAAIDEDSCNSRNHTSNIQP